MATAIQRTMDSNRIGAQRSGLMETARRNSLSWAVSSDETATPFLLPAKKMPVSAPRRRISWTASRAASAAASEASIVCRSFFMRASTWRSRPIATPTISCESLLEVVDQVVGVLEADRKPQQVLRRSGARTLDRGAVLDEALRPAEARGSREDPQLRRHLHGARPIALHLPRDHAPEGRHLTAGHAVRR